MFICVPYNSFLLLDRCRRSELSHNVPFVVAVTVFRSDGIL